MKILHKIKADMSHIQRRSMLSEWSHTNCCTSDLSLAYCEAVCPFIHPRRASNPKIDQNWSVHFQGKSNQCAYFSSNGKTSRRHIFQSSLSTRQCSSCVQDDTICR